MYGYTHIKPILLPFDIGFDGGSILNTVENYAEKDGTSPEDCPAIVRLSQLSTSMKGNPLALTDSELLVILDEAI